MTESNSGDKLPQDSEIIAALRRRDPQALADLYDRYGVPAYSLALHILGDAVAAQETVAAVFAQIWQQAQRFVAETNLQTRILAATNFNALEAKQQRDEQARRVGVGSGPSTRPMLIPRHAETRMPGALEANFQLRNRNEKEGVVRKLTPRFDIKP